MHSIVLRAGLLALVAIVFGAVPASAHAALVGADPGSGSTQATEPASVTLRFNENVGNAQVAARAPDGSTITVSEVHAVDNAVTATLAEVGQKGRYAVSFRVVSADGHPVSGTITYSVTSGRAVTQVQQAESQTFLHRHSDHLLWGVLVAAIAIALLLAPLRRRDDADRA